MTFFLAPGCSSWFSGVLSTELDDAQDVTLWRRLYLAVKPSHVGVDVDGLACPLHSPMIYNRQTRRQGFLSGVVLSHH
jgi:hypothetical protein